MSPVPLLEVRNLTASFAATETETPVVTGVDLEVGRGEVLGIIGESGSGKTVTCMSILRLLPDHARIRADAIRFDGVEIGTLPEQAFRAYRGRRLAMIFQDPVGSFNPVKTIGWHFREASRRVTEGAGADPAAPRPAAGAWREEATATLSRVGIPRPGSVLRCYPHQLSGGMLQRALIALVLQMRPGLIVADEPTTNLDNIVEHQIIALFRDLIRDTSAAFIFITHDMAVAARLCDRIAVMYAGEIVETGPVEDILRRPRHPYAQGLVRTSTELTRRVERLREIPGDLPNWRALPEGCRFRPRCPFAREGCERPQPMRVLGEGRAVRCLLAEEGAEA